MPSPEAQKPPQFGSWILAKQDGENEARKIINAAEERANAKAAKLLAAQECPPDLIAWGRAHGIPTFAEVTWQAGFLAGMRAANLPEDGDSV